MFETAPLKSIAPCSLGALTELVAEFMSAAFEAAQDQDAPPPPP